MEVLYFLIKILVKIHNLPNTYGFGAAYATAGLLGVICIFSTDKLHTKPSVGLRMWSFMMLRLVD